VLRRELPWFRIGILVEGDLNFRSHPFGTFAGHHQNSALWRCAQQAGAKESKEMPAAEMARNSAMRTKHLQHTA
jgi:hypothetical protein